MKKYFFTIFLLFNCIIMKAQFNFNKIIPPTPEASHLEKEVKVPMDYSTGVPNISIPLYELTSGNISIPITLSYHASGIKVDQLSSSVGLGWGLDAGGAVQRTIRGKADNAGWNLNNYTNYFASALMNDGSEQANDYMLEDYDFTQDDYSYNFSHYSGSFFFDSTKTIRKVMDNTVELKYFPPGQGYKYEAKDYSGLSYYFDSTDASFFGSWPSVGALNTNITGDVSAWRLTKVKDQGIDSVILDYEKYNISYESIGADLYDAKLSFLDYACNQGTATCGDGYDTYYYHMILAYDYDNSLIKSIQSKNVRVNFYYSNDNNAEIWKRKLDSLTVTSLIDSSIIRRIYLTYSRFSGNAQIKLTSVRKIDLITGEFEETRFEYYENNNLLLPQMGSRSKDMFGFFNGKTNSSLIVTTDPAYVMADGDRTVNAESIILGTLKKISFTSGGFTEFIYEPNKINDSMYGPGIRIKKQLEYNTIDSKLLVTSFDYFGYHGQTIKYPYSMVPQQKNASYARKLFSSDEPVNYRVPLGVRPIGYSYDSVVSKIIGIDSSKSPLKTTLMTSYKFQIETIYNGYRAYPTEVTYYGYNSSSDSYNILKKEITTYNHQIFYNHSTPLLGILLPSLELNASFTNGVVCCKVITAGFYTEYSYVENTILKNKEQVITYNNNTSITDETRYYYANLSHLQPTRIVHLNSGNDSTITVIKYPSEMISAGLDGSGIYQGMVNNNLKDRKVIEEKLNAQNSPLSKTIISYQDGWIPGVWFTAPQSFQIKLKNNVLQTLKEVHKYDHNGNIIEYSEKGQHSSILWDYGNSLPIAMATSSELQDIAYTSFETPYHGNWEITGGNYSSSYSVTGKKSFILNYGDFIKKVTSISKNYIVSYWTKNGSLSINGFSGIARLAKNGWEYYEHLISGTTLITISCTLSHTIDELRVYPVGSQMQTYCYNSFNAISEVCDANNRITYYKYDGMKRLASIMDIDKNIVKKIETYLPQSGNNTLYYNSELSESFEKKDCGSGYSGSSTIYTVSEGRYSSRISQKNADTLAHREIEKLGQIYANLNGSCTVQCANCTAINRHCSDGVCLRGLQITVSLGYNSGTGKYECMVYYQFSDGYSSPAALIESDNPCDL